MKNIAFIDGQNLHLGTREENWSIDLQKFRVYLKDKYAVSEAYYFLGYVQNENQDLYDNVQKAGFILKFKEHNQKLLSTKKGNVDADLVFQAMKALVEDRDLGQIVLVSGDGDYKKLVDYFVDKGKFRKILFPNKRFASSLYKKLGSEFFDYLSNARVHIEHKKEKGS